MWWGKRIYLDSAAGVSANPSSPHCEGREARELLEAARIRIARLVEAKSDDVLFTSGATEANALAILGVCRAWRGEGRPHMLYLPSAHASVVENVKLAEAESAVIEALPIKNCQVDCDALRAMLCPETILVSMDAVCGETGIVWNTRDVARTIMEVRLPLSRTSDVLHFSKSDFPRPVLHVDASQAVWTEKLLRAHFGADLMTLDASKVSSVRGIGCLIAPAFLGLIPLYAGGGQERGLRPGSEAPELARTFADGLVRAVGRREDFRAAAAAARIQLVGAIRAGIPSVLVNEGASQAPHILNISLPGRDTDYLVALLDEAGFAVSTRSACESNSEEGSRAVFALFGDTARAAATLRISWGPATRARDLARFAQALARAVTFVDSGQGA